MTTHIRRPLAALALPALLLASSCLSAAGPDPIKPAPPPRTGSTNALDEVVVSAQREALPAGAPANAWCAEPGPDAPARAQDGAALLRDAPGTAIIRNGSQTGIVQMHGLANERVRILLDGMTLTPACPNHMDPPLHYAAPSSVQSVAVMAGLTPVSLGGDSLAGTVVVNSAPPAFSTSSNLFTSAEVGSFYRGSQDAWGAHGRATVAGETLSAGYNGSWSTANDLKFPGGRVLDSSYRTMQHDVLFGLRSAGTWSAEGGYVRTRDTGNPSLPMDMIKDDGYRGGLGYANAWDGGAIEGRFFYHKIDHLMDNYSLRPPPAVATQRMFSPATSEDIGYRGGLTLTSDEHTFRVGNECHVNNFDAYQQNAQNGIQQDTFHDASRSRVGTWAEWQADWSKEWTTQVGFRNDTVWSGAGAIDRSMAAAAADARFFNAAQRTRTDADFDAMASVRYTADEHQSYELGFARKSRSPSLLERYLWTPLSASAGQADGRTYLGNLSLGPEVSHQVSATADWHGKEWQVTLSPFYQRVSDYIQGTPISRTSSGLPVLQYQNVNRVDLEGADAGARCAFFKYFTARAAASYVRGVNKDNGDNLYRIPPLHGTVALEHRWGGWENVAEVVLAARQGHVAAYNGELPTGGYALLNLRTGYTFKEGLAVEVGVENVLDKLYADHLGGVNRVMNGDVAVGGRIPNPGRFLFGSLTFTY
jgi:iron complex outermembrane receptor protein